MTQIEAPASEAGRVLAALSDYATRQRIVRRLRESADNRNSQGDSALQDHDFGRASAHWAVAARCIRAAQAISSGKVTNPDDYILIRNAYRHVEAEVTS